MPNLDFILRVLGEKEVATALANTEKQAAKMGKTQTAVAGASGKQTQQNVAGAKQRMVAGLAAGAAVSAGLRMVANSAILSLSTMSWDR